MILSKSSCGSRGIPPRGGWRRLTESVVTRSHITHALPPPSGESTLYAARLPGCDFVLMGRRVTFPYSVAVVEVGHASDT